MCSSCQLPHRPVLTRLGGGLQGCYLTSCKAGFSGIAGNTLLIRGDLPLGMFSYTQQCTMGTRLAGSNERQAGWLTPGKQRLGCESVPTYSSKDAMPTAASPSCSKDDMSTAVPCAQRTPCPQHATKAPEAEGRHTMIVFFCARFPGTNLRPLTAVLVLKSSREPGVCNILCP